MDHLANLVLTEAQKFVYNEYQTQEMPEKHMKYLQSLKDEGFYPKVAYDIGAACLAWTRAVTKLWPKCKVVCFDAHEPAAFLYKPYLHYIGLLCDKDDEEKKFYTHEQYFGGNSYYREVGSPASSVFFPESAGVMRKGYTLDTIVSEYKFPLPDLVKIDLQGAEVDVFKGGVKTIAHAEHLLVELQQTLYNKGAPMASEAVTFIESHGWECVAPTFSMNGPFDADYGFRRVS